MSIKHTFGLLLLLAAGSVASAQSAYTPEKGSPERKAILDALRIPVERDLKQKVVFVADNFKVQGNFAFVSGIPQNSSGGDPDYARTKYADQVDSGAFDTQLLRPAEENRRKMARSHLRDRLHGRLLRLLVAGTPSTEGDLPSHGVGLLLRRNTE